jgi:hypothetical protein
MTDALQGPSLCLTSNCPFLIRVQKFSPTDNSLVPCTILCNPQESTILVSCAGLACEFSGPCSKRKILTLLSWSLILHWILAVTNSCNMLRWVTRFPCDIFGFYVAFIYLQKGIQVLERLGDGAPSYLSIMAALLVFMVAYVCGELGTSNLFRHPIRVFLKDYGTPLTLIFFTGFVHIGRMKEVKLEVLPTSVAFLPTSDRGWLVNFWDLSVGEIFTALPFAILLTVLFWFDHNGKSNLFYKLTKQGAY